MQFSIQREKLLKPLQQAIGVVEKRHTKPILANFLVEISSGSIRVTGSDEEVEIVSTTTAEDTEEGSITVPARKFFDIIRSLSDGAIILFNLDNEKVKIKANRGKFTLSSLPANEFPVTDDLQFHNRVTIPTSSLKQIMGYTAFAMANQDVRYYLNGMLLELENNTLRCVATDGHRLALATLQTDISAEQPCQIIIPRKGVHELAGLLDDSEENIELQLAPNHLRVKQSDIQFTTKLIDGKYPDYSAVIPIGLDKKVTLVRNDFYIALQRASILSNEKFRGVRLEVENNVIRLVSHNPEREEAIEELEIESNVEKLDVAFNVGYLMEALASLSFEKVCLHLRDDQSSCLITGVDDQTVQHVVMPLRL